MVILSPGTFTSGENSVILSFNLLNIRIISICKFLNFNIFHSRIYRSGSNLWPFTKCFVSIFNWNSMPSRR
jgi:hypothetical protein